MPPESIDAAYQDMRQKKSFSVSELWKAVRNPTGSYLSHFSQPASMNFTRSLTDLDAYQRMLAIKYGESPLNSPVPSQGFKSKAIVRSEDGRMLSFAQTPGSLLPERLTTVALANPQH
jgi:hypothetical protein